MNDELVKNGYRVTVTCRRYTVTVDAVTEDQARDEAIERARWEADFEADDVVMVRGQPPPVPLPDFSWVPEPARSLLVESFPGWDPYADRVWSVLINEELWATNGHWVFRLPAGTPAPGAPFAPTNATTLVKDAAAATEAVQLAAEPHGMPISSWESTEVLAFACGRHWPLTAAYVDLLQKVTGAEAWFFRPERGAFPAVLRNSEGEAVAMLMPRRPE